MVTIENGFIRASVTAQGAELQSLYDKTGAIEHLWQGDANSWHRQAPVLFPIVGKLKNDTYTYDGKTYHMPQHGFARDKNFELISQTPTEVIFQITDDLQTREMYPFQFALRVRYALINNLLKVRYTVENTSETEKLYYSVGGHPGFQVPFVPGTNFEDYYLSFSPRKSRIKVPIGADNLIDFEHRTLAATDTDLTLTHDLFAQDAWILETLGEDDTYRIKTDKSEHYVELMMNSGPYVGIWSSYPKTGDFVCIEPWWGIADGVNATGDYSQKAAIRMLEPGAHYTSRYRIGVF